MNHLSKPEPARFIDAVARRYRRVGALAPLALAIAALSWGALCAVGLRALPWQEAGSSSLTWLSLAGVLAALGFVLWQIYLASRYAPLAEPEQDALPPITVVVPAYNEGEQVVHTLVSLAQSHYPIDRLQIIAVDDGSQDDTWAWMRRAARKLGGRVELLRLDKNRGKRHALAAGFARATGKIIVTVDSDSEVRPDTLASLTAPFLADGRVGAVAGNIRVFDRQRGLIAQILDAAFTYSFELIRAGQSTLGAVLCTPGAAAAGCDAVIVCDPVTDVFNPNVVRASTGVLFSVPLVVADSAGVLAWLRAKRIRTVATTPSATQLYTDTDLRGPLAVIMGSEQYGLSDFWLKASDQPVRIPMAGQADSLNVAMATIITLFEAVRQRSR